METTAETTTTTARPPMLTPSRRLLEPFCLNELGAQALRLEEQRNRACALGRRIHVALRRLQLQQQEFATSNTDSMEALEAVLDDLIDQIPQFFSSATASQSAHDHLSLTHHPRQPRLAPLSSRVEDWVRHKLFRHYLDTGRLMPLSSERFSSSSSPSDSSSRSVVTDEEYLLACMGLTADLYRYGMVQATAIAAPCDVGAVRQASNLVSQLHEYLSTHDFRNGPLRRRYDATSKYALKGLETLLYELTVVAGGGEVPASPTTDHLPDSGDLRGCSAPSGPRSAKRPRSTSKQDKKARDDNEDDDDAAWPLLPSRELRELRERMERRDELREALIKRCRDAQKWAKQSIFALHRGDHNRARKLLHDCRTCIGSSLLPVAREEPPLRTAGPLSGVLEEYAEARLFAVWLYGENSDNDEGSGGAEAVSATNDKDERSVSHPTGTLLRPEQFDDVDLSAEEYLGGLCDLTGEVGRYAVHRGTVRDVKGVQLCHRTVTDIFYAIETMERLPPGIGKKLDSVRIGIEKMERMLYELSLSEAAGGRYVKSDVTSLEGAVPLEGTTEE